MESYSNVSTWDIIYVAVNCSLTVQVHYAFVQCIMLRILFIVRTVSLISGGGQHLHAPTLLGTFYRLL